MYKKMKYTALAFLLICAFTNGQNKITKKAKTDYDSYAYEEAINSYEYLVKKGHTSEEIYKNLGNANYQNANYEEASKWYAKLFDLEGASIEKEYLYQYAQTLKSLERYKESDQWMEEFNAQKPSDNRAVKFAKNPNYMDKIKKNSGRYDIKNLLINSIESDFAPSFKGEKLVFSSARDTGRIIKRIHEWDNKSLSNLYLSLPSENGDFTTPEKLSKALNKKTHESSTAFTKDGTTVYFTRNNSKNGKFLRDQKGLSRLKIYRATLEGEDWTNIIELPFNDDSYSVAHPTLNFDENKLYFSSNMPGTYGQSDIFVVNINSDGTYGAPKNLGSDINTEGRETFPFVTEKDVLYFASDGQPGLGGLDIFATKIEDLNNIYLVNVGKPVNSKQDDFSFVINDSTRKGFFASNREGGLGSDDIYSFIENEEIDLTCNILVEGIIIDKDSSEPIAESKIIITDMNNQIISETTSNSDGTFSAESSCKDGDYKLTASKDGYDDKETMFTVKDANDISGIEVGMEQLLTLAPVGSDLIDFLKLSTIYFDLDKADIRPDSEKKLVKVIKYLNLFPDAKIEIQSHTDAKESHSYNQRLSERRGKKTVAYLSSGGIDKTRLTYKGFGETKLINDCTDANYTKCSDAENELNRRSEFIVIN